MRIEFSRCDGCGERHPSGRLDAVLLDEEGSAASDEAYCRRCFPSFAKVAGDRWRPSDCSFSLDLVLDVLPALTRAVRRLFR